MGFPYRCSDKRNCGVRKSLRHPLEWYYYNRKPKCPGCGRDTLRFDYALIRQRRKETCRCSGIHYPHRYRTWLSKDEFCDGWSMAEAESRVMAEAMGATDFQKMKPDDPCPF